MKFLHMSSAIGGILSPLVLASIAAIVSSHRPDYSHLRNTLSDLGAVGAPNAVLMDWGGVIPAGLLTAFSAIALQRALGAGAWSVASIAMLVLGGAGLAATAMSPWRGDPSDLTLLPNRLHLVFALTGFLCIALAPLFFAFAARATPLLRVWFLPSLGAGIGVLAMAFWPLQGDYRGFFQRAALAIFFLWLLTVCAWMLREPTLHFGASL